MQGRFYPVTANNLVMNFYSPFVTADGSLTHWLHYNVGYRFDEVADEQPGYLSSRIFFFAQCFDQLTQGDNHADPAGIDALPA